MLNQNVYEKSFFQAVQSHFFLNLLAFRAEKKINLLLLIYYTDSREFTFGILIKLVPCFLRFFVVL